MPVSDVLKSIRKDDYGAKPESKEEGGPRLIKLTDDEAKGFGEGQPGEEVTAEITGRLEGSSFTVISVKPTSTMPDEKGMAGEVMGKMEQAPMVRPQTMPYPG